MTVTADPETSTVVSRTTRSTTRVVTSRAVRTTTVEVTATRTVPTTVARTVATTITAAAAPAEDPTTAPAPDAGGTAERQELSGSGDDVLDVDLGGDARILTFACPSCSSNVALQTDGSETLLVNDIGAYRGRHFVNAAGDNTRYTVTADASWTITLEPTSVLAAEKNRTSGSGDDVVLYDTGSKATVTHTGESNFAVIENGDGGKDLLVNEVGNYTGTVPLSPPCIVQITADGDWTFIPS